MFEIKKEHIGRLIKYKLSNKITGEYFTVISSFGANINEIVLKKNNNLVSILEGESTEVGILQNKWFKGAKLIPFSNRINNGKYSFENKEYHLIPNQSSEGHSIHGLLFNKKFSVSNIIENDDKAEIELEYSYVAENKGYPFSFRLQLNLTLNKQGININTKVQNIGDSNMPFGDGWHPYFKFDEPITNIYLKVPKSKKILVNNRMIPTGKMIDDSTFDSLSMIGDSLFDTGYAINEKSEFAITQIYSKSKNISINLQQQLGENKYNFLQVFIPPSRNSIAIEPMTSCSDAFNNKLGLIVLKPNEVFSASYSVYLS